MEQPSSSSSSQTDDVFIQWQRFVSGLDVDASVRPVILESWRRSAAAGVQPEAPHPTRRQVTPEELEQRLAANAELVALAVPHLEWLSELHATLPHAAYLVDTDGIVLCITGADVAAAETAGVRPGADWSEAALGTNGAGTALACGETVVVDGAEHFARALHGSSCTGAPVRGPDGAVHGAIGISTDLTHAAPNRRLLVAHAAYVIEQDLRLRETVRRTSHQLEVERQLSEERAERLATLEALRASEARYERIAANVPGVVYQFTYWPDGSAGFTFVSEGVRALCGVVPEAVLQDSEALFGLVHPEDRPWLHTSGRAAVAALVPWQWEGRLVLPTGEVRWIQVASRNGLQPDGSIVADGLIMDVTERRQAAARLEESDQRFRSLFRHHPDAVFSTDTAGRYLTANPACEVISGYTQDELIGKHFAPLIVPEDLEEVTEHFRAAVERGESRRYEIAMRHKLGHTVPLDVTSVPIIVNGTVVGVFGIVRDLTRRHALEAQLRQAQKMEAVGQLAGGIAHDFNNILAAITGVAGLLLEDIGPASPHQTDVEEILKGARRAAGLTRQLLAFSRKQVLQPEVLDLNEIVQDTVTMLRPLLGSAVHVFTLPAPAAVPVFADRTQLEQVLMNLAVNARDAMPNGGTLTIEVGTTPAAGDAWAATLVVSDTGMGMPPDVAARAFEPFFTTKPLGQGTGLGLATVHGIVEQSGGTVRVSSDEGQGTTFTITLPLAESAANDATIARQAMTDATGAGTVLLVEDEEAVRTIARRVLERAGYQVLTARHGADALHVLEATDARVDVLLSDVVMPEMGGVELAALATARVPDLRVVLMSGYADTDVGVIGKDGVVAAFVAKPFTAESLVETVREVVRAG
ncbi:MAG TPA: PAS domain S-box protein [Gemmatimonadaceae bacterium]